MTSFCLTRWRSLLDRRKRMDLEARIHRRKVLTIMALDWTRHLTADPRILSGDLCAKGTRVPVATILDAFAEGSTEADILRSYPSLKPVHLRAAVAYAAQLVREEALTPIRAHATKARREPARRAR